MPVGDGMTAFGFAVHVNPSFMQVARSNGRHVLRDGYHRAIGLLEKGIRWVPVLTREFSQHDDMGLQTGLLPRQVFLGERPPMLTDYQEEVVSAEVNLPASQKLLLIQAIEIGMLL